MLKQQQQHQAGVILPDMGFRGWKVLLFHVSSAPPDLHFCARAGHGFCRCHEFEGKHWVHPLHFPPCSTRTWGIPHQEGSAPSLPSSSYLWIPLGGSTTGRSGNNLHMKWSYAQAEFHQINLRFVLIF